MGLILGFWEEQKVGDKKVGIVDSDLTAHKNQPFVIVRQATFEEWFAQERSPEMQAITERHKEHASKAFFYEVATD